jgi:hypothetical protein
MHPFLFCSLKHFQKSHQISCFFLKKVKCANEAEQPKPSLGTIEDKPFTDDIVIIACTNPFKTSELSSFNSKMFAMCLNTIQGLKEFLFIEVITNLVLFLYPRVLYFYFHHLFFFFCLCQCRFYVDPLVVCIGSQVVIDLTPRKFN